MNRVRPYLAPWYRIATDDDRIVLEYGQRILCLEGGAAATLVPVLLPLLDGTRTIDEIVRIVGEPVRPAIEAVIDRLEEHELLVEGPPLPSDPPGAGSETAAFLSAFSGGAVSPAEACATLECRSVMVVGEGLLAGEICRLLRQSGLRAESAAAWTSGVDLVVCAPASAQLPDLVGWNRRALESGQPWLQVLPFDGRYAAVGPLYVPDETCCFECFRLRRAANLGADAEFSLVESAPATRPATSALHSLVAGIASTLALDWLVLEDHHVPSAFYALELAPSLGLTLHFVHRVPRCAACSGLTEVSAPLPWFKEAAVVSA